jgi:hypothetical protein
MRDRMAERINVSFGKLTTIETSSERNSGLNGVTVTLFGVFYCSADLNDSARRLMTRYVTAS